MVPEAVKKLISEGNHFVEKVLPAGSLHNDDSQHRSNSVHWFSVLFDLSDAIFPAPLKEQ